MKKPIVICGFPGIGKSCAANNRINILDAESSAFHWSYDTKRPEMGRKRNIYFPQNYIAYIKEQMNRYELDIILVACHKEVRDALKAEGIKYIIVAPYLRCKNEYMIRYLNRGSDFDFIESLYNNWDKWIGELDSESAEGIPSIRLDEKQYLLDVVRGFVR